MRLMIRILAVFIATAVTATRGSSCPRSFGNDLVCAGHGKCVGQNCECLEKYFGADCSRRACPMGVSWHSGIKTECSSRGLCNYADGTCSCFPNFAGHACEKLGCAGTTESALSQSMSDDTDSVSYAWRSQMNKCNGRGVCMSSREYERRVHGIVYDEEAPKFWDRIFGCMCDEGYEGYDCSIRTCPHGDDPQTKSQSDEVQLLRCKTFVPSEHLESFSFRIGFESTWSVPVAWNETVEIFEKKINEIQGTLGHVQVIAENLACDRVCCADEETVQVLSITFLENFGDLPPLRLETSVESQLLLELEIACVTENEQPSCLRSTFAEMFRSSEVTVSRAVMGTKENLPCSGRGLCLAESGYCECLDQQSTSSHENAARYATSDGRGGPGTRGDCGYEIVATKDCDYSRIGVECSGHGRCSYAGATLEEFACECDQGWTAYDCSERSCPKGFAWGFGPPNGQWTECSNRGTCDITTGICVCDQSFTGSACQIMQCPTGGEIVQPCSGHGNCVPTATSWDRAHMIHECVCDPGYEGVHCGYRSCPRGDNPTTPGHTEQQTVSLTKTFGRYCYRGVSSADSYSPNTEDTLYATLQEALAACDSSETCKFVLKNAPISSHVFYTLSDDLIFAEEVYNIDSSNVFLKNICTVQIGGVEIHVNASTLDFQDVLRSSLHVDDIVVMSIVASDEFEFDITIDMGRSRTQNIDLIPFQVQEHVHGLSLNIRRTRNLTFEHAICNDRGICDDETGLCRCFDGWVSEDSTANCGALNPIPSQN